MTSRREFITFLGSAAASWPLAAQAQQASRMRRIGVLMAYDETDPRARTYLSGFTTELSELGWTEGRTARLDIRWAAGDVDRMQSFAKELVDLQPDAVIAHTTPVTAAFQQVTRAIPIIFVLVSDPVGSGFVASLPRPGGNTTGLIHLEGTIAGKWLELLTEIAPRVKRVAAMFNPDTAPYVKSYYLPSFEAAARSFKVEPIAAPVYSDAEIEAAITPLGREPGGGGLVVMPAGFLQVHRSTIISSAARNNVPAIYSISLYAKDGGLLSYGSDEGDLFRRAALYVDRILRGTNPADLPVQAPAKYELALNLKTAKALSLSVPASLQQLADEVIE
jgi:putative ABC transport system substrate-binding protein